MQYDLLIKNGYVVDYASAREGYFDVAVQNGMIAAVESRAGAGCVRQAGTAWLGRFACTCFGLAGRQLRPHDAGKGWCDQCFGYVGAGDQCTGAGA